MNDQMILKALVEFEGKWPELPSNPAAPVDKEALVLLCKESYFEDGEYKEGCLYAGFDGFNVNLFDKICTRAEFGSVLAELVKDSPEGATHYDINDPSPSKWVKFDGFTWRHNNANKSWAEWYGKEESEDLIPLPSKVNGPCFFKEEGEREKPDFAWPSYDSQLISFPSKLDATTEQVVPEVDGWIPEIGQEFEWMLDGVSEKWNYGYFVGYDREGDMTVQRENGLAGLNTTKENHHYIFRPLKTEAEKERDKAISELENFFKYNEGRRSNRATIAKEMATAIYDEMNWRPTTQDKGQK